ncbi:MAG: hypothetical protein RBS57_20950, partial [Desulforhabdus sp.]|nr:hypothetical protein [Desulforhabdus sp.]
SGKTIFTIDWANLHVISLTQSRWQLDCDHTMKRNILKTPVIGLQGMDGHPWGPLLRRVH